MGIVHEELPSGNTGETLYVVMVTINGQDVPITCTRMSRFGGAHNYEEYSLRGYNDSQGTGSNTNFSQRPGDTVIVAFLDGVAKQGVILGGIRHPSRPQSLEDGSPAYKHRFNGIEKEITSDGAMTYTYKGIMPAEQLDSPPTGKLILGPEDDPDKAGSTFGFDADGNFNIGDGDRQAIVMTRDSAQGGNLVVTSGTTVITIAGGDKTQTVDISTKGNINLEAAKDATVAGSSMELSSETTFAIDAKTGLSITSAGGELLDLITTLIDELGTLIVTSPTGPCSPIMAAPTWTKVLLIQTKIKLMMG
ncbi:MAG: hypothetical protein Q9M19_05665 [Mariprofundaceae bacterium]|nr:hypothetical protein [Mariprofundaceae bacterium]